MFVRLHLVIQEKQGGNDINRFDDKTVAICDEILEYKCITPTQHKKTYLMKSELFEMFKLEINYTVDRPTLSVECVRYTLQSLSIINDGQK